MSSIPAHLNAAIPLENTVVCVRSRRMRENQETPREPRLRKQPESMERKSRSGSKPTALNEPPKARSPFTRSEAPESEEPAVNQRPKPSGQRNPILESEP
jgi:hypothetical protein